MKSVELPCADTCPTRAKEAELSKREAHREEQ